MFPRDDVPAVAEVSYADVREIEVGVTGALFAYGSAERRPESISAIDELSRLAALLDSGHGRFDDQGRSG